MIPVWILDWLDPRGAAICKMCLEKRRDHVDDECPSCMARRAEEAAQNLGWRKALRASQAGEP